MVSSGMHHRVIPQDELSIALCDMSLNIMDLELKLYFPGVYVYFTHYQKDVLYHAS